MTCVRFDRDRQLILIDGIAPKAPRTLTATWDGFLLRVSEITGRGILAIAPTQLVDGDGNSFVDGDTAMAYLHEVFTSRFVVDGGVI